MSAKISSSETLSFIYFVQVVPKIFRGPYREMCFNYWTLFTETFELLLIVTITVLKSKTGGLTCPDSTESANGTVCDDEKVCYFGVSQ